LYHQSHVHVPRTNMVSLEVTYATYLVQSFVHFRSTKLNIPDVNDILLNLQVLAGNSYTRIDKQLFESQSKNNHRLFPPAPALFSQIFVVGKRGGADCYSIELTFFWGADTLGFHISLWIIG